MLFPLKILALIGALRPVHIFVTDLNMACSYCMFEGLRWFAQKSPDDCDVALSSQMMELLLVHGYGYSTVHVSGRVGELKPHGLSMLSRNFVPLRYNEMGYTFPSVILSKTYWRYYLAG